MRAKAFYQFEKEIMMSLQIYQIDENVRKYCIPVSEWLSECIKVLQKWCPKIESDYKDE